MQPEKQSNHTFILRLWREKGNGQSVWRGSLTIIQSGKKKYFQSINDLAEAIAFIVGDSLEERNILTKDSQATNKK